MRAAKDSTATGRQFVGFPPLAGRPIGARRVRRGRPRLGPAGETGARPGPGAGYRAVEEVVVTAQKKEEKVQDVPISVGVVSSADVEKKGLINIDDLGTTLPNVECAALRSPRSRNSRSAA